MTSQPPSKPKHPPGLPMTLGNMRELGPPYAPGETPEEAGRSAVKLIA
jgi:hypothetical protein